MAIKVGINGFGAVGRRMYRIARRNPNIEMVSINGRSNIETMVHLLKYDSTYGPFDGNVEVKGERVFVDGKEVKFTLYSNPGDIPWADMGVDVVVDSTGAFRSKEAVLPHIEKGGAKKVIITAPGKNEDITIVMGVNHDKYIPEKHHVISAASCTTTAWRRLGSSTKSLALSKACSPLFMPTPVTSACWIKPTKTCAGPGRQHCRLSPPPPVQLRLSAWYCRN